MNKGTFITIYGINNIGKTTHAKRLVDKLKAEGYDAIHVKYPVYDVEPTGPMIDHVLRNPDGQNISENELQLWFVLNRYQYQPELEKMLNDGKIVVAEDYTGTGIAWGVAKGLEREWLEAANKFLLKEDFALWIDGQRDTGAMEDVHVHERNYKLVAKCAEVHKELANDYGWNRIELQKQKNDTAELIWQEVDDYLKSRYS